jgi:hypothetical protein
MKRAGAAADTNGTKIFVNRQYAKGLRDDAPLAKSGEEIEEAVVGGLVVEEAKLSALAHIGDDFDGTAEVGVGVPGGGETIEIRFDQVVRLCDVSPDFSGASELLLEGCAVAGEGSGVNAEPLCETGPHPTPAKYVSVDDVEGLVAGCRRCRGPLKMASEQSCIGHIGKAIPLGCRAGEEKRPLCFAADGGVGGEGDPHVHGVAEGVADDGVGAMYAPGKTCAGGGGEDFVFLGVVEVVHVQAALLLAERGSGETTFAVGLEGAEVVFETGHQRYVANRVGTGDGVEEIANHGAVDAYVFRFRGLSKPGGKEDVGGIATGEGRLEGGGIEEVGRDGLDAAEIWGGTAGQAEDVPLMGGKESCEVVADDTSDAGDECSL